MDKWKREMLELEKKYKYHKAFTKEGFKQKLVELKDKEYITIVAGCGLEYEACDCEGFTKNDFAEFVYNHLQGCYENVVAVY